MEKPAQLRLGDVITGGDQECPRRCRGSLGQVGETGVRVRALSATTRTTHGAGLTAKVDMVPDDEVPLPMPGNEIPLVAKPCFDH